MKQVISTWPPQDRGTDVTNLKDWRWLQMGEKIRAQWRTIQKNIRRIIQAVDNQAADCIFLYVNIYFK